MVNQIKLQFAITITCCDQRGLPLALVNAEGKADWSAEYDAWGNVLSENFQRFAS
ncbi:TPA: RHS domain-containing protein [Salmonella enterica subsp. salamae serovar 1,4,12,[27]:b:[e,n,x]]|uniref:RHS domain-containing protein n=1 Tax=Salmonella enterica TaxID=28901 RepID=UPI0009AA8551|nr:hypothetical protein [Salmonella enterica subsp. enterica serovar Paratyphi B]EDV4533512.1 hypothetical protein [Salmonella enterica subsp. enterica]QVP46639.1 RHS domain-containing protein [Salmonella enterica subsp. salamae]